MRGIGIPACDPGLFKSGCITPQITRAQLQRKRIFLDRHAEVNTRSPAISVTVVIVELRAIHRNGTRELFRMLLRDDIHDAAHSVRTPDGRRRPANHFDALNSADGRHEDAPRVKAVIDHTRRRILLTAVNKNQRVGRTEAADRNVGGAHFVGRDVHARNIADGGTKVGNRLRREFLFRNHGNTRGRFARVLRIAGSGNNGSVESGVVVIGGEGGGNCHRKREHDESFAVVVHCCRMRA